MLAAAPAVPDADEARSRWADSVVAAPVVAPSLDCLSRCWLKVELAPVVVDADEARMRAVDADDDAPVVAKLVDCLSRCCPVLVDAPDVADIDDVRMRTVLTAEAVPPADAEAELDLTTPAVEARSSCHEP